MKRENVIRILVCSIAMVGLIWFIIPILSRILNIGNLLGIAVCVSVLLVCVFFGVIDRKRKSSGRFLVFTNIIFILFIVGIVWSVFLTGCMIYGAGAFGTQSAPPADATVVVLGSKVNGTIPSLDLKRRLNVADTFLKENKQALCIVSGGRGAGEQVTEASAMKAYLVKQGIEASRITTEEQSTSTEENLKYSLALIKKNNWNDRVAIVTDEYHQFRAARIAESLGGEPYAVCSRTPGGAFSALYARELLALSELMLIP